MLLITALHTKTTITVQDVKETGTYPLGSPLSLIKGTNEVGVLDSCVSGAEDDTPDSTVLEVCEATENTPGLALPLADSVTVV